MYAKIFYTKIVNDFDSSTEIRTPSHNKQVN